MKEGYFKITNSELGKDCIAFYKNNIELSKLMSKFLKDNNIESKVYGVRAYDCELSILPTENDKINFKNILKSKTYSDGLKPFKMNSKIQKKFKTMLEENNFKLISKPDVGWYVDMPLGGYTSRLFDYKNDVYLYLKIDTNIFGHYASFTVPEGFEEMKASEFYKILEEREETKK